MKSAVLAVGVLVLVGAVSVVLAEVVAVTVMNLWPASIDVLGNYFVLVVVPAELIVAVAGGLVLSRALRRVSFVQSLIYPATFAGLQFVALGLLKNPLQDRLTVMTITVVTTMLVVLWRRKDRTQKSTP